MQPLLCTFSTNKNLQSKLNLPLSICIGRKFKPPRWPSAGQPPPNMTSISALAASSPLLFSSSHLLPAMLFRNFLQRSHAIAARTSQQVRLSLRVHVSLSECALECSWLAADCFLADIAAQCRAARDDFEAILHGRREPQDVDPRGNRRWTWYVHGDSGRGYCCQLTLVL